MKLCLSHSKCKNYTEFKWSFPRTCGPKTFLSPIRLVCELYLNFSFVLLCTAKNTLVIISTSIAAYIFEIHGMVPFSLTGKIPPGIPSWSHPPYTVTDPATNVTYYASDIPSVSIKIKLFYCYSFE